MIGALMFDKTQTINITYVIPSAWVCKNTVRPRSSSSKVRSQELLTQVALRWPSKLEVIGLNIITCLAILLVQRCARLPIMLICLGIVGQSHSPSPSVQDPLGCPETGAQLIGMLTFHLKKKPQKCAGNNMWPNGKKPHDVKLLKFFVCKSL